MKTRLAKSPRSCHGLIVIGKTIRSARRDSGRTLDEIARSLGVTPQTLSRIELGRATTTSLLERFAAVVGLEIVARRKGDR